MSALTAHSRPGPDDDTLAPIPWRRMGGVTWRQHRYTLAGVAGFLAALAIWIGITGRALHASYATAVACHPAGSIACQAAANDFNGADSMLASGVLLQIVPALIGAFVGAPLLARELETGTFRYAWTQGVGRSRWAAAKLLALALTVTVAAGLFGWLLSWYYQPYFAPGNQALGLSEVTPFLPGLFDLNAVTLAAWTLAAFAIGAVAGMLLRRVVLAVVAALAAYAALAFAVGGLLRQHYLTPLLTTSLNVPESAWITGQWWTKGGAILSPATMYQVMQSTINQIAPVVTSRAQKQQAFLGVLRYLAAHGYTQWTRYQPASRLWPFQWIEAGWLIALSALLMTATVWLVRRRAA
jgi:ABC-type transport system involved in multi-copper enzyme maturation permease subunit